MDRELSQESKSNLSVDNVVVPIPVETVETLPMHSNARITTANKEVRDCLKSASVAVASDPLLRDYFRMEPPNQQSVERVLFLLEENIPLKTLADHMKETNSVSAILSGLVQVSLRDEIRILKEKLKKSQERNQLSESCVKKVEEAAHELTVKSENVAKKEFECAQRELACELILENEARRVQSLLAQIQQEKEKERLEFQRQTEIMERRVRDLTARLEIALKEKAAAEENLRDQVHRSSDEKLFEAFKRLKALVTAEHTHMHGVYRPREQPRMESFAEKGKEFPDSKDSQEPLHSQISDLLRDKEELEHRIRCQLENTSRLTSEAVSAKAIIAGAEERLQSLQKELERSRIQNRSLKAFFETDVKQLISTIRSSLLDIKTFAVDIEAETNSSSRLKEQYLDLQDDARRFENELMEARLHNMRMEEENQFLQSRLNDFKLQARDILKTRTVEVELKSWELFANDVKTGIKDEASVHFIGPDSERRNRFREGTTSGLDSDDDAAMDNICTSTLRHSPWDAVGGGADHDSEPLKSKAKCGAKTLFCEADSAMPVKDVANRKSGKAQAVQSREPFNAIDENSCESNELASFCRSCAFALLANASKCTRQPIQLPGDSNILGEECHLKESASSSITHGDDHPFPSCSEHDAKTPSHKTMASSYIDEFIQLQREIKKLGLQQYGSKHKHAAISGLVRDKQAWNK